jgi:hypothetical protein
MRESKFIISKYGNTVSQSEVVRLARHVAHIGTVRNVFIILVGDLGIDGKIILKFILKIQSVRL